MSILMYSPKSLAPAECFAGMSSTPSHALCTEGHTSSKGTSCKPDKYAVFSTACSVLQETIPDRSTEQIPAGIGPSLPGICNTIQAYSLFVPLARPNVQSALTPCCHACRLQMITISGWPYETLYVTVKVVACQSACSVHHQLLLSSHARGKKKQSPLRIHAQRTRSLCSCKSCAMCVMWSKQMLRIIASGVLVFLQEHKCHELLFGQVWTG
jgi:hypothetical protein